MEGKVRVLALVGEAGHKAERDTNIEFIGINEPGERGDLARRMIAAGYPMVGGKGVQVIRLHCSIPCDQLLKGDYQQAGHGAICHLAEEDRQALRPHFERLHEKYDYWD
jgi:hypothetical protein